MENNIILDNQRDDKGRFIKGIKFSEESNKMRSKTLKRKFANGERVPVNKGKKGLYHHSKEKRKEISEKIKANHPFRGVKGSAHFNYGKIRSEEYCKRLSERMKDNIPWNKGIKGYSTKSKGKSFSEERRLKLKNVHNTEEVRQKHRLSQSKRKETLGYINSPETRKKLSENAKINPNYGTRGKHYSEEVRLKHYIGKNNPFYGKTHSDETRKKLKEKRALQITPMKDSKIEVKIQTFLKLLGIEFFTHQYIKEIEHGYQCDILIPSMNLVIECDGIYWHKYPIGRDIDHIRTKELLEKGFKVLRLWELEINNMNIEQFKEKLFK